MIDDLIKITVDREFMEYYQFIAHQNDKEDSYVKDSLKIQSQKLRDFPDN